MSFPHLGVSKKNLLSIFHGGVLEKYRRALDTESYRSFANLNANQGEQLMENLAQSDAFYGGDYDRDLRDLNVENQRFKDLNEKLEKMSKTFLINQKPINYLGEFNRYQLGYQEMDVGVNGIEEVQEEVHYVGNQRGFQGNNFNQNYMNHPNLSYWSTNMENPQDQVYLPQQSQGQGYQPRPYFNSQQVKPQGNQGGFQARPTFTPNFQGQMAGST